MIVRPQFQTVADFFQDALRLQWLPSIPSQSCRLLQHVTDYLLDIRFGRGLPPARDGWRIEGPAAPGSARTAGAGAEAHQKPEPGVLAHPSPPQQRQLAEGLAGSSRCLSCRAIMAYPPAPSSRFSSSWRKGRSINPGSRGRCPGMPIRVRRGQKKRAASRTLPFWLAIVSEGSRPLPLECHSRSPSELQPLFLKKRTSFAFTHLGVVKYNFLDFEGPELLIETRPEW